MTTLAIIYALDDLLPKVLSKLVLEYCEIKDSIDGSVKSMYIHNNIIYTLRDYHVVAYNTDLDEIERYNTNLYMTDLSVDNEHIYIIAIGYGISLEVINKKTNIKLYFVNRYGGCITLYNSKLYVKLCNDTKINVICSLSGALLRTIETDVYSGDYTKRCKLLFRENEMFITYDYKFIDTNQLITINNNYDICAYENKICLYSKNTLYKKNNNLNIPLDEESISKIDPIDEIIIDHCTTQNNKRHHFLQAMIKYITSTDTNIYICIDHITGYKIIVCDIYQNKIIRNVK
jgi:hypothetical protein